MFWRGGSVGKPLEVYCRYLTLKITMWLSEDTFQILMRMSKHPGQTFIMMVQLHSNCQKNHLCHQLGLQRTSLQDELKYWMSTESNHSKAILLKLMRRALLNAFQTLKIALTGMGTWITHTTAKTTERQTMNQMWNWRTAVSIQIPRRCGMWLRHRIFLNCFGLYDNHRRRLKRRCRRSTSWKQGVIRGSRKRRTECVNVLSPSSVCILSENGI